MPRAKRSPCGLVLVPVVTELTEENRRAARSLTRERAAVAAECRQAVADQEARVADHAARVQAELARLAKRSPRPCRNCGRVGPGDRRRGLCKPCYRDPAVRARFARLPSGWAAARGSLQGRIATLLRARGPLTVRQVVAALNHRKGSTWVALSRMANAGTARCQFREGAAAVWEATTR